MSSSSFPPLSTQERRVVAFAIRGLGDKQIARAMDIAVETVRTYWVRIREKSGGVTRAEIVARHVQSLAQGEIDRMEQANATLTAEIQRREIAEARLQAILDSMPLGAFFANHHGELIFANRAWGEMMGVPCESAANFDLWCHIHPEDRPRVAETLRHNVATKTAYRDEHRIVRGNGSVLWVSLHMAPVSVEEGDVGYVGTVENITLRHEHDQAVRHSEAELRALADLLPHLVLMTDGEGVIQFANAEAFRYFGRDLDGLRRGRWVETVHPDDAPSVVPFISRTPDRLGPLEQQFRIRRAEDGEFRWHLARIRPEIGSDGRILRWLGVFSDIHELYETRERLTKNEGVSKKCCIPG